MSTDISTEQAARTNADIAINILINDIETDLGDVYAALSNDILTEKNYRLDADAALQALINSLEADIVTLNSTNTTLQELISDLVVILNEQSEQLSYITAPVFGNIPENQTIYFNAELDLLGLGLTAIDNVDGIVTSSIIVNHTDTTVLALGEYDVIYTVIDSDDNIKTKTITLTIESRPMEFVYTYFNEGTEIRITDYSETSNKDVIIPDFVDGVPITEIGDYAFNTKGITSVVIGGNVTTIGDHAFYNNQLTTAILSDSVVTVGLHAFAKNVLESIVIPDGVVTIADNAFRDNPIVEVTFGSSLTSIGLAAFYDTDIAVLTIPSNVVTIGTFAFNGNNFTSITILGDSLRFNSSWTTYGFDIEFKPVA